MRRTPAQAAALSGAGPLAPETAHILVRNAMRLAEGGRLGEAEDAFRHALALDPTLADGYFGLGLLALSVQQYEMARGMLEHAIKLAPRTAAYHNAMGRLHKAEDRPDEAEKSYLRALELDPRLVAARVSLGIVYRDKRRLHEAVDAHREALLLAPAFLEAHVNLMNALRDLSDLPTTRSVYESLIERHPEAAEPHYFYATLLQEGQREEDARRHFEAAARLDADLRPAADAGSGLPPDRARLAGVIDFHRRILERRPGSPEAHYNLSKALHEFGDLDEALEPLRRAIELKPDYLDAHLALGRILLELRFLDQGAACMRQALTIRPESVQALTALAAALLELGEATEAETTARKAVDLEPAHAEANLMLGNALLNRRRQEEAYRSYRAAIAAAHGSHLTAGLNNLLFTLNYSDRMSGAALLEEHRAACFANARAGAAPPAFEHDRSPDRRLRIAYVSPDLRSHAVAVFLEPLLECHDRERIAIVCFDTHAGRPDATTSRLRALADEWHECGRLSDDDLVTRLRESRVDIVVDLAGHTGGSRLFALSARGAPVQMTMLGYPTTSGMPNIDYRITDWHVDPPGWEDRNSEVPLRLPHSYFCFRAPLSLEIGPLPARRDGCVTFGSLNNLAKVSDATLDMWCEVLRAVPASRLILKHKAFGDAGMQQDLLSWFEAAGIERQRVTIAAWEERGDSHLQWYNRIDVALDTYPYNGATTTCEALWMGVPVVTLAGDTHASRMGLSILAAGGLGDLAAASPAEYVARAAALAADLDRLEDYRANLRTRLAASPLCDAPAYARAIEGLFRDAWRQWCAIPAAEAVA